MRKREIEYGNPYPERGIANHPRSGTQKSHARAVAAAAAAGDIVTSTFSEEIIMFQPIHSYRELQQQIHEDLRIQHPEWVNPNGDCPTCDSYELRLAELLGRATAVGLRKSSPLGYAGDV